MLGKLLARPLVYRCGTVMIHLSPGHRLPEYRAKYPQSDTFLPKIAKRLEADARVIDIGANCGDTLAALVNANASLNYICVEADPEFFRFLRENARHLAATVETMNVFVGQGLTGMQLEGEGGSRHAVPGGTLNSMPLDTLVHGAVRLLKCDVGGYDYNVIDSAARLIGAHYPILFFECQFNQPAQLQGCIATVTRLAGQGYHFTLFDNFGVLLQKDAALEVVVAHFQSPGEGVVYHDLLCYQPSDAALVESCYG